MRTTGQRAGVPAGPAAAPARAAVGRSASAALRATALLAHEPETR